jgi:hypothetical protein
MIMVSPPLRHGELSPDCQGPQPLTSIQSQRHARWLWGFFEGVHLKKSVPLAFFWPWGKAPQEKRATHQNDESF